MRRCFYFGKRIKERRNTDVQHLLALFLPGIISYLKLLLSFEKPCSYWRLLHWCSGFRFLLGITGRPKLDLTDTSKWTCPKWSRWLCFLIWPTSSLPQMAALPSNRPRQKPQAPLAPFFPHPYCQFQEQLVLHRLSFLISMNNTILNKLLVTENQLDNFRSLRRWKCCIPTVCSLQGTVTSMWNASRVKSWSWAVWWPSAFCVCLIFKFILILYYYWCFLTSCTLGLHVEDWKPLSSFCLFLPSSDATFLLPTLPRLYNLTE